LCVLNSNATITIGGSTYRRNWMFIAILTKVTPSNHWVSSRYLSPLIGWTSLKQSLLTKLCYALNVKVSACLQVNGSSVPLPIREELLKLLLLAYSIG
jgi:hypothetical protein